MEETSIDLRTLAGGAAMERFDYELNRVLENILDPNTSATLMRKITLSVSIKPNADRTFGPLTIEASAKLAPLEGYKTQIHFGRDGDGKPVAVENNPNQYRLFEEPAPESNVKPIRKKESNQ